MSNLKYHVTDINDVLEIRVFLRFVQRTTCNTTVRTSYTGYMSNKPVSFTFILFIHVCALFYGDRDREFHSMGLVHVNDMG